MKFTLEKQKKKPNTGYKTTVVNFIVHACVYVYICVCIHMFVSIIIHHQSSLSCV